MKNLHGHLTVTDSHVSSENCCQNCCLTWLSCFLTMQFWRNRLRPFEPISDRKLNCTNSRGIKDLDSRSTFGPRAHFFQAGRLGLFGLWFPDDNEYQLGKGESDFWPILSRHAKFGSISKIIRGPYGVHIKCEFRFGPDFNYVWNS